MKIEFKNGSTIESLDNASVVRGRRAEMIEFFDEVKDELLFDDEEYINSFLEPTDVDSQEV